MALCQLTPTRVKSTTNARGDTTATFTFMLPVEHRPVLNEEVAFNEEVTAGEMVRVLLTSMAEQLAGFNYFRIILGRGAFGFNGVETFDDAMDEAISTPFMPTLTDALERLEETIDEVSARYDDVSHLIINDIKVVALRTNPENGAAAKGKRRTEVTKTWLVPGEYNTQENCFYVTWGMLKNKERFVREYVEWLEGTRKAYPNFKDYAKDKKKHMKRSAALAGATFRDAYVDNEQIAFVASHSQKSPIMRIYGQQNQLLFQYRPPVVTPETEVYEMQRAQNHYRPMIRWNHIDPAISERIKAAIIDKDTSPPVLQKAQKIREVFKGKEARDRRFVTWDLEASTDADGNFKAYAAGMAWYRIPFAGEAEPPGLSVHLDGELEILYVDFWGLDALTRMVEFIAAHRHYFAESYFWAHNGGKFDVPLLLREALFDFDGATIEGKRCTILNGRWIGFQALFLDGGRGESRIYFRDSLAVIQGGLEKLCKEYAVPHQKLVETVSHDDITLDNFDTFEQLPRYLLHDCLGLLELIDRFGAQIFDMSWTEKAEKHYGERNTANVLETLLSLPHMSFTKQRPSWLTNANGDRLELDGYCEDVMVAFEFQDEYHFDPNHIFHKKAPGGYAKRVADDKAKVEQCAAHGVKLVVVPYSEMAPSKLVRFCERALTDLGIMYDTPRTVPIKQVTRERVIDRGGICLSKVMTAAGIAKRTFFNRFYGKYAVYTLTKEQDAYIRNSYFGGRVELFHLGIVHGNVYYLDYTSLYPAMEARHLLPYGEPVVWSSFPQDEMHVMALPKAFFGFARCLVRSTELGKLRKPLHGIKNAAKGGKLLFAHIDDWREVTLFSEEIRKGEAEGLYEYRAIDGLGFKRGYVMREANETLFAMKAQAKAEGKSAMEKALKIVINSMYGFWGLRTEKRESVKIFPSQNTPVYDYLSRNALVEEVNHGKYTCLRVIDDLNVIDFNVGVAAAITSWARVTIWGLMDDIDQRGGKVFSCDTDSVTTNFDLSQHMDLLEKHVPDWETATPGAQLGSLKCECTDEIEKLLKKRGFKGAELNKAMAFERGSESWKPIPFCHPEGTLVNGANKLYALRTRLKHGGGHELCKAKGMTKGLFTFDNYVAMFDPDNPKPLTDPQMQIRMGLNGYCTEGGIQPVRKVIVPKRAYACYNKGVVDSATGKITPFCLPGTHSEAELAESDPMHVEAADEWDGDDDGWDGPEVDEWDGPDEEDWDGP